TAAPRRPSPCFFAGVFLREYETRRLCPLPLREKAAPACPGVRVGEGSRQVNYPHPFEFAKTSSCSLPQGERAESPDRACSDATSARAWPGSAAACAGAC